ncbi:hypothetical protein AV530_015574 [Patagioenas fasciata monilis]|uniref:Uncharacterized protein n=1 Tax=Patagioenas fasciata monilis TaxID=372326 RepID=A0A1V4KHX5_PATFA|nr:hypothetical protein AV530_015574 [Patagioenas fasciata monilis]
MHKEEQLNTVFRSAAFKWDKIPHFVADVDIHFISDAQRQPHRCLLVYLRADDYAVSIVVRKAILRTPLRNLYLQSWP